jgi:osmoprotectant transport system substrate-binding protein
MKIVRSLLLVAAAVALIGCQTLATGGGNRPTIRIGSTNFAEQTVLAELYGQALEANGYKIERKLNLGNREIVAPAIESGQIDLYAEYLATYLVFQTKDPKRASSDPAATYTALQDVLASKNLTVLDFAPAIDTNGFVVTKETAQKYGLTRMSDLAKVNEQLILGAPPECPTRPFCLIGLQQTYGLKFKEFKPLDAGGPLTVAALKGKQIDVALLFTTDAVIQTEGFVLLQDDKRLQQADNVAPVVRNDVLQKASGDFRTLLNQVSQRLTTEELTTLNRQVGVDKKDPRDVAGAWLRAKGIVK